MRVSVANLLDLDARKHSARRTRVDYKLVTHSEVLEGSCVFDVGKGGLEILQFGIDLRRGLLRRLNLARGKQLVSTMNPTKRSSLTYRLRLESVYRLQLSVDIVRDRLEALEEFFSLVDDLLVLQNVAVLGEVDGGGLAGGLRVEALSVGVALAESLKRRNGLCWRATGGNKITIVLVRETGKELRPCNIPLLSPKLEYTRTKSCM